MHTYTQLYICECTRACMYACMHTCPLFLFAMAKTYFGMPDASTLGATSCMCVCVALASRRAKHTSLRRPFSAVGSCLRPMPAVQFVEAPAGPGWVYLRGRLYYVTDRMMWNRAIYSGEYERARTYVVKGKRHPLEASRARDSDSSGG